tara:strand:+ start:1746 stop:2084 length:339 start_codon:yes stop_codon:yes gene_type:complete
MAAAHYNIEIDQGSDFNITIEVKEDGSVKDLTTYSARAQARADIEDSSAAFSFTCTIPTPTNGKILMKLPAATSSAVTAGEYVYDLEVFTSGDAVVSRLMGGKATISREVTR